MPPSHYNQPSQNQGKRYAKPQQGRDNKAAFEGPIPSPYNFVPLSDHVVFPPWASLVSQDIPFKDGLSGHIDIEIEAVTPIYIRNGGDHPENRRGSDYTDFFRMGSRGPYAIPGTSIKGMLRNTMEIVTKGKLRTADRRYAVRDLNTKDTTLYRDWMTTKEPPHRAKPMAGWLEEDKDGTWKLYHSHFVRVEREDLKHYFRSAFPGIPIPNLQNSQRSIEKRMAWGEDRLEVEFSFTPTHQHKTSGTPPALLEYPKVIDLGAVGSGMKSRGTIVFTGQPTADTAPNHTPGKKHLEFIFYNTSTEAVEVPEGIKTDFIFIHSNDEKNPNGGSTPNDEWAYWKRKLQAGHRVPVFYLAFAEEIPSAQSKPIDVLKPHARLHSMGLALMYRLAYKWRTSDLLRRVGESAPHFSDQMDFAETLFGRIHKNTSLKGRVQVEPAINTNNKTPGAEVTVVLNSPKPSFYPSYIWQKGNSGHAKVIGDYKTYMDDNSTLRGWKRYPARSNASIPNREGGNDNITTSFRSLPAGSRFKGRINCHNLRPQEAGALLWCLTFGGKEGLCHSLGMAKPYGFGAVRFRVQPHLSAIMDGSANPADATSLMNAFAEFMAKELKTDSKEAWLDSPYLKELFTMADNRYAGSASLKYPSLGSPKKEGTFANHKRERRILPWYSEIVTNLPAAIPDPSIVNQQEAATQKRQAEIAEEFAARAPFEFGSVVESHKIERTQNKKGKVTYWIHFSWGCENFKANFAGSAKNQVDEASQNGDNYRFKITGFNKAKPSENITLDFADDPPAPLP